MRNVHGVQPAEANRASRTGLNSGGGRPSSSPAAGASSVPHSTASPQASAPVHPGPTGSPNNSGADSGSVEVETDGDR